MRERAGWACLALALLSYPFLDVQFAWGTISSVIEVLLYVIIALGLNVVVGFGGLLNLGYAAFFSVGAFTMALVTSPQTSLPRNLPSFWIGLLLSCLLAVVFGAVIAAPTLRLRGDYVAIVTMGFGLMLPPLLKHYDDYTMAQTGLAAIASPHLGPWEIGVDNDIAWYFFVLAFVVLTVIAIDRLRRSRFGRALKAMREDELAAGGAGINLVGIKLLA
ncbi:MAG: branched-chain amino acid ABC transporter permease, partial [Candidatus Xenobia bacterium]